MNARIVAVLVLLLVALGGGALLVRHQQGGDRPAGARNLGQPVLKGLQGAEVTGIVIRQPKDAITIQKKDNRWVIAERDSYPADLDKVRDFVLKAIALKVAQSEPIGEKDRARLQLDAGGTSVELQGANGKPLARFIAGKKYFKGEPENPDKAIGDGRYLLLPEDDKRVIVVSDPLTQATPKTSEWISKTGINAEKIRTMEVKPADGSGGWKIERSGDNADWKLIGAGGGEKLEITKANAASYTMSLLEVADVAPKSLPPAQTGLDKPTVVTATTFDGLTYTLNIGKLEGDSYFATVAVAGQPKPEGKDAEERLKKLNERLPRELALSAYTLRIPKAKLDDILKKRADLLEKKEDKSKK
jgi:hypothetical protein